MAFPDEKFVMQDCRGHLLAEGAACGTEYIWYHSPSLSFCIFISLLNCPDDLVV